MTGNVQDGSQCSLKSRIPFIIISFLSNKFWQYYIKAPTTLHIFVPRDQMCNIPPSKLAATKLVKFHLLLNVVGQHQMSHRALSLCHLAYLALYSTNTYRFGVIGTMPLCLWSSWNWQDCNSLGCDEVYQEGGRCQDPACLPVCRNEQPAPPVPTACLHSNLWGEFFDFAFHLPWVFRHSQSFPVSAMLLDNLLAHPDVDDRLSFAVRLHNVQYWYGSWRRQPHKWHCNTLQQKQIVLFIATLCWIKDFLTRRH